MPKSGKEGIKVSPLVQEITAFLQAHIHEDDNLGRRLKFDYGDAGVVYIDGSQRPNVVHNRPEPADCTVYLAPDVHWRMLHLELDQSEAFRRGQMRISGDVGAALRLRPILQKNLAAEENL